MFCKNCGKEITSGKFCGACGTPVEDKVEEKVEDKKIEEVVVNNEPEIKAEPVEDTTMQQPVIVATQTNSNNSNTSSNVNSNSTSQKSKIAAGLLGIFLGSIGVHNFYLGYTGKAVAQLLISILSCGSLLLVSAIWGMVEGIMILATNDYKDAEGKILSN